MFRPAVPRCTRFLSLVFNPAPCSRLLSSGSYGPRDLPKPPAGISLPLAPHQQAFLAAGSSILAILNPWRGDMIAVLGETTGDFALRAMQKSMLDCAEGREIMQQRPRVDATTLNLTELSKLPPNTFGFHYAQFMNSHGFDPQDRAAVRFVSDPDLAYVLQRYREAHDFWHVLCDVPIDVSGELALKWLEMLQTGQPMTAIASLFGPLRLSWAERARFRQHFIPWAIQCNRSLSRALITVYYEKYMHMDIDELRKLLGVIVAPRLTM